MGEREKQLVGFRAWKDEYDTFKELCRQMRTTPTAKLNELMREAIAEYKKAKSEEKSNDLEPSFSCKFC